MVQRVGHPMKWAPPGLDCRLRNVKGKDVLIWFSGNKLHSIFLTERMTPDEIMKEFRGSHYFLWNKNVRLLPPRLRGVLFCVWSGRNTGVWVVLRSDGLSAHAVRLLPTSKKPIQRIVSLREHGYCLQQILGEPVGSLRDGLSFPYLKKGYITMNPKGPDILVVPNLYLQKFEEPVTVEENQSRGAMCIPNVDCLYVLDNREQRMNSGTPGTYLVPIGHLYSPNKK